MRRLLLAGLCGLALSGCSPSSDAESAESRESDAPDGGQSTSIIPVDREIRFAYTVRNQGSNFIEDAEFKLYAPVPLTSTQRTTDLTASHDFKLETDGLGNQVMIFQIALPPHATKIVSVRAEVALTSAPQEIAGSDLAVFLSSQPLIESADPEIEAAAINLRGDSDRVTAKSTYDWVRRHVRDVGYVRDALGAARVIRSREGDCTEFAYLFAALNRASGVPARAMEGYVLENDGVVHSSDLHDWAEFYSLGLWRIADPQQGVFAETAPRYVATRVVGPAESSALGTAHRFQISHPNIEVRMN